MRPSPFVATLFVLTACEEAAQQAQCDRASEVARGGLDVGLGEERFEQAIEDGMAVRPAFGSQGGQHLWLAVRTRGFAPGGASLLGDDRDVPVFTAELLDDETGELVTIQEYSWDAMRGDEVEAELALGEFFLPYGGGYYGDYYLEYGAPASEDATYVLRVTGEDVCGNVYVDEHPITLE